MLKVLPALEAYALANIATQNLVGGSPAQFLLGDLNATSGTGLQAIMGPQPGVLTLKEFLMGEYNYSYGQGPAQIAGPTASSGETWSNVGSGSTAFGSPLQVVASNFQNNIGNIVVGTALTTAGFRIFNKVMSKPKNKMNSWIRKAGLGSTIQL